MLVLRFCLDNRRNLPEAETNAITKWRQKWEESTDESTGVNTHMHFHIIQQNPSIEYMGIRKVCHVLNFLI
jgi:hypothetical protein